MVVQRMFFFFVFFFFFFCFFVVFVFCFLLLLLLLTYDILLVTNKSLIPDRITTLQIMPS